MRQQISKIEKKLIQQIDLRNEVTEIKSMTDNPNEQKRSAVNSSDPLPSPPYSVIVTPATPQGSIPRCSSSNQFSLVKSKPSKTFSLTDGNAQPTQPEPFFLHQSNNHQQHTNNALPPMPASSLEYQTADPTNRSRSRSTRKNKKPVRSKSIDGMIEYASLDFFMTDTKYQTAECSSSEKQVRFSMTTIRTPPNSPNPSFAARFSTNTGIPVPNTNPLIQKNPNVYKNTDKPKNKGPKAKTMDDLKVNFLERLEVLPESQA